MRPAATAPSLVDEHDPVRVGIEEPAHGGVAPRARPAVQDDNGGAVGAAALLPKDALAVTDIEQPLLVGVDGGIQRGHCGMLACGPPRRIPRGTAGC